MKPEQLHGPPSIYTQRMIRSSIQELGRFRRDLLWMWNPRHLDLNLATIINYESYPKSQDEVDQIVAKNRLKIKVVHDP